MKNKKSHSKSLRKADKIDSPWAELSPFERFSKNVASYKTLKGNMLMAKFDELNSKTNDADRRMVEREILKGTIYLVKNAVWKYKTNNFLIGELISASFRGLNMAIEKFDITKGGQFEPYARMWIRKYLIDAFNDKTIRIPSTYCHIKSLIQKEEDKFIMKNGYMPCDDELAEMAGVDMNSVILYRNGGDLMCELPNVRYDDDEGKGHDPFEDVRDEDGYVDFYAREHASELSKALSANFKFLSDKQRYVIEQYCGMNPQRVTYSFSEIGREMGMTDVAVGKQYRRGIAKLRNSPILHDLYEEANTRDPYLNY